MTVIKLKRATALKWHEVNPVLAEGEPGVEIGTHMIKVGDGRTPWNDLPYDVNSSIALDNHIVSDSPHPVYDDGPSFRLLYENAKV